MERESSRRRKTFGSDSRSNPRISSARFGVASSDRPQVWAPSEIAEQNVGVVGATALATVHTGIVEIPELGFSQVMPLFALKVRRPTHDVLLGRSLLQNFIVTFDGPTGLFHFSTPVVSYDPHDFDE